MVLLPNQLDNTVFFKTVATDDVSIREVLQTVYQALEAKGYNPVNQIVGYILSGDPAYITSYNNARKMIRQIDRDDLVEELLRSYMK